MKKCYHCFKEIDPGYVIYVDRSNRAIYQGYKYGLFKFLRRVASTHHIECRNCYIDRTAVEKKNLLPQRNFVFGIFYHGSGVGNQLHRYVMTRVIARDRGWEWGMINPELFKCHSFLKIDTGLPVLARFPAQNKLQKKFLDMFHFYQEKKTLNKDNQDIRDYDFDAIKNLQPNTIIDGEFQGEKYYEHRLSEIREWLACEPIDMPDDVCAIGFRGGEYVHIPGVLLPKSYWEEGIQRMRKINPKMKFIVYTDDLPTAQDFFPNFQCIKDTGISWRSIRYAKYLIIANSSFYILPSLLGDAKVIYSPKFWAGRNRGYQQSHQNIYKRFIEI